MDRKIARLTGDIASWIFSFYVCDIFGTNGELIRPEKDQRFAPLILPLTKTMLLNFIVYLDGKFGAMMSVGLTNEGPVTFTLDSRIDESGLGTNSGASTPVSSGGPKVNKG